MKRLLVTGGAGFIGCNFVRYWMQHHPNDRVLVLDSLTYAGSLDNLAGLTENANYRFVKADINDQVLVESLMREEGINWVVHFAAESHVDRSISGPGVFIETNIVGTHKLLDVARKLWLDEGLFPEDHRFHHISTDEVYGSLGPNDPPFTEKTPYAPNSPYAASKAASDHLVRAYNKTYGLNTTISNCSNNFGPYQHPEKLIPTIILNALEGRPIPIYGDGKNIRDWLHVVAHCRGIELILEKGIVGETYNIGGDNELDNLSLCNSICSLIDQAFDADTELKDRYPACPASKGKKSADLITFVEDRLGHDERYAICADKLAGLALKNQVNDFKENLNQVVEKLIVSGSLNCKLN